MVTVIIPAAGQGRRMNSATNKIFLPIQGKPVLIHTLEKFSAVDRVSNFIIAAAEYEIDDVKNLVAGKFSKPIEVIAGGSERQFSINNCLQLVPPESEIVLVHDAARPLVSKTVIENVIDSAEKFGASIAAVREKNTVKFADDDLFVEKTLPRSNLWEVQTPQGFRRDIIFRAYESALKDHFVGTDDSSLVERIGIKVKIVESDSFNIKITTPDDLIFAQHVLNN